jgi:hypothetical protein
VQCTTACDCNQGEGCIDGQCVAGQGLRYCCDAPGCPMGFDCQHASGNPGVCP